MKMILGGVLLFFGVIANATTADTMAINVNTAQPQFQFNLPANPTTGYQWTVTDYDKSLLQLVSSQYIRPQSKLMGAGGQMLFTFALVPGQTYPASTDIHLKYAQPWEPQNGSLKTVTVNFKSTNN